MMDVLYQGKANVLYDERKILEDLVVENADLERLEELLSPFNIFEAIGAVR